MASLAEEWSDMESAILLILTLIALPYFALKNQGALVIENGIIQQSNQDSNLDIETKQLLKPELLAVMSGSGVNGKELLVGIRCALSSSKCPASIPVSWAGQSPPQWAISLTQTHPLSRLQPKRKVSVTGASDQDYRGWIEYTIQTSRQASERVRLDMGVQSGFNTALTGNHFICTFCHVTVYGDIAQYWPLDTANPYSSRIHGRWLTAQNINAGMQMTPQIVTGLSPLLPTGTFGADTDDNFQDYFGPSPLLTQPPVSVTAATDLSNAFMRGLILNYTGPSLPINFIRQEYSLPKLDPNANLFLMTGTLSGPAGSMLQVPYGASAASTPAPLNPSLIHQTYRGNVILNGRDFGPLTIDGRVFVEGDIIIFGKIQGKGEIYASRNIYIADDLTYVNPPPVFDGQAAHNQQMTFVSNPVTALQISQSITNYDKLGLFAVNNIVLGDPYPERINSPASDDSQYIITTGYGVYDGEIAFDTKHGYQADVVSTPTGNLCFLLPWQKPSSCVQPTSASFSSQFTRSSIFTYPTTTSAPNDQSYYMDRNAFLLPQAYQDTFYPKNMVNGAFIDWITPQTYRALTLNPSDVAAVGLGIYHKHPKDFILPIPGSSPYDPNGWPSGASAYTQIHNWVGLGGTIGSMPADNDDPAGSGTLQTRFQSFFDLCRAAMTTGLASQTGLNLSGVTRNTYIVSNSAAVSCSFYYNPSATNALGGAGRVDIKIVSAHITGCTDAPMPTYYPADATLPRCQTRANGISPISAGPDIRLLRQVPFSASIIYGSNGDPFIKITTQYWDPTILPIKNRINALSAYLFANHFITYAMDTQSDRQLRVYGGLMAKDIFGRFTNKLGPERTYLNGYRPANAGFLPDSPMSTSLLIMQDPRFADDTQIIDSTFGQVIIAY